MNGRKYKEMLKNTKYYNLQSILGYYPYWIKILLGARGVGKSYAIMDYFLNRYKKTGKFFYWLRLSKSATRKLLNIDAKKLVDPDLKRKYNLNLTTNANYVYNITKMSEPDKKGKCKILEKELMCKVIDLSTMGTDKGANEFDKDFLDDPKAEYNLCLDEFAREEGERNTFDVCNNFVMQMETLIRTTRTRVNCFIVGNLTGRDNCIEFLSMFNFIPNNFGRYTLVKHKKELDQMIKECKGKTADEIRDIETRYHNMFKDKEGKPIKNPFGYRAVVEYLRPTEAQEQLHNGTFSTLLLPESSNVTNKVDKDTSIISKKKLIKPTYIIKFYVNKDSWFTVWDDNTICKYNNENTKSIINMRPYLDGLYNQQLVNNIIDQFDSRCFTFRNMIVFQRFQYALIRLKPRTF